MTAVLVVKMKLLNSQVEGADHFSLTLPHGTARSMFRFPLGFGPTWSPIMPTPKYEPFFILRGTLGNSIMTQGKLKGL